MSACTLMAEVTEQRAESGACSSYPESRRNSTKSTAFEVDEIIVSRLDRRSDWGKTGSGSLHLHTPRGYTCTLPGLSRADSGGSKSGAALPYGRDGEALKTNIPYMWYAK